MFLREYRFLFVFMSCWLGTMMFLVVLGACVDPRGIYGTGRFPVLVATARVKKCSLLKLASPKPEALILGSSHCMRYSPAEVEKLAGLGCFNLSVNSGKMEDSLALLKSALLDMGVKPKLVILGVCPRTFCKRSDEGFDDRLIANYALMRHLPLNPVLKMLKLGRVCFDTLKWSYLMDVRKSLKLSNSKAMHDDGRYVFEIDGFLGKEEPFNDKNRYLKETVEKDLSVTGLSTERKRYFDIFVQTCRKNSIQVKVVITPYAPGYIAQIDGLDGSYSRLNMELLAFLQEGSLRDGYEVFDCSNIEKYNGVDEFMGAAHPSIYNSTLILREIFREGKQ